MKTLQQTKDEWMAKVNAKPTEAQPDTARHSPEWWGAFDSLNKLRATFDSESEAYFYVRNRGHMHQGTHKPIVNNADKLAEALRKIQTLTWSDRPTKERLSLIYAGAKSALADYEGSAQ